MYAVGRQVGRLVGMWVVSYAGGGVVTTGKSYISCYIYGGNVCHFLWW